MFIPGCPITYYQKSKPMQMLKCAHSHFKPLSKSKKQYLVTNLCLSSTLLHYFQYFFISINGQDVNDKESQSLYSHRYIHNDSVYKCMGLIILREVNLFF